MLDSRLKRWASHLDDIRTEIAGMEAEGPPEAALVTGAHDAINTAIRFLNAASKPDTDEHRYALIRAFINEARTTVVDLDVKARVPVQHSRLRQIRQSLDNCLATLGWFDQPYCDERSGA